MKKTLIVLSISLFTLAYNVKAQDHRHAVVNPTNPEITEYWDPEVKVITLEQFHLMPLSYLTEKI